MVRLFRSDGRSVYRSSILWIVRPGKCRFAANLGRSIHETALSCTERPTRQRKIRLPAAEEGRRVPERPFHSPKAVGEGRRVPERLFLSPEAE